MTVGLPALLAVPDAATITTAPAAPAPRRRWRWFLLLVALGAFGVYLAAPAGTTLRAVWHRLAAFPVTTVAIVLGGALGLVATEAVRIAVFGWLVGARIRARDCWDAAVANHVMTAITPQVGLGEPAVAYLLGKRGVAWDAAVAIPFLKFTTSLALVFALGAGLALAGFGPPVAGWIAASGIALFLAIAAVTTVVLGVCARPALARRVIAGVRGWLLRRRWFAHAAWQDRIADTARVAERMVDRLDLVRLARGRGVPVMTAVHLLYYASYVAPLCGLALVLADPPLVALALRALVYLCFVFAMPTPGGAGPSEAAAVLFFADLVPAADAIIVVAAFRAATFYLQLAIGIAYLPIATAVRRHA